MSFDGGGNPRPAPPPPPAPGAGAASSSNPPPSSAPFGSTDPDDGPTDGQPPDFDAIYAYAALFIDLGDQVYEYAHNVINGGMDNVVWTGDWVSSVAAAKQTLDPLTQLLASSDQNATVPSAARMLWNIGESINWFAINLEAQRAQENREALAEMIGALLGLFIAFGLGVLGILPATAAQMAEAMASLGDAVASFLEATWNGVEWLGTLGRGFGDAVVGAALGVGPQLISTRIGDAIAHVKFEVTPKDIIIGTLVGGAGGVVFGPEIRQLAAEAKAAAEAAAGPPPDVTTAAFPDRDPAALPNLPKADPIGGLPDVRPTQLPGGDGLRLPDGGGELHLNPAPPPTKVTAIGNELGLDHRAHAIDHVADQLDQGRAAPGDAPPGTGGLSGDGGAKLPGDHPSVTTDVVHEPTPTPVSSPGADGSLGGVRGPQGPGDPSTGGTGGDLGPAPQPGGGPSASGPGGGGLRPGPDPGDQSTGGSRDVSGPPAVSDLHGGSEGGPRTVPGHDVLGIKEGTRPVQGPAERAAGGPGKGPQAVAGEAGGSEGAMRPEPNPSPNDSRPSRQPEEAVAQPHEQMLSGLTTPDGPVPGDDQHRGSAPNDDSELQQRVDALHDASPVDTAKPNVRTPDTEVAHDEATTLARLNDAPKVPAEPPGPSITERYNALRAANYPQAESINRLDADERLGTIKDQLAAARDESSPALEKKAPTDGRTGDEQLNTRLDKLHRWGYPDDLPTMPDPPKNDIHQYGTKDLEWGLDRARKDAAASGLSKDDIAQLTDPVQSALNDGRLGDAAANLSGMRDRIDRFQISRRLDHFREHMNLGHESAAELGMDKITWLEHGEAIESAALDGRFDDLHQQLNSFEAALDDHLRISKLKSLKAPVDDPTHSDEEIAAQQDARIDALLNDRARSGGPVERLESGVESGLPPEVADRKLADLKVPEFDNDEVDRAAINDFADRLQSLRSDGIERGRGSGADDNAITDPDSLSAKTDAAINALRSTDTPDDATKGLIDKLHDAIDQAEYHHQVEALRSGDSPLPKPEVERWQARLNESQGKPDDERGVVSDYLRRLQDYETKVQAQIEQGAFAPDRSEPLTGRIDRALDQLSTDVRAGNARDNLSLHDRINKLRDRGFGNDDDPTPPNDSPPDGDDHRGGGGRTFPSPPDGEPGREPTSTKLREPGDPAEQVRTKTGQRSVPPHDELQARLNALRPRGSDDPRLSPAEEPNTRKDAGLEDDVRDPAEWSADPAQSVKEGSAPHIADVTAKVAARQPVTGHDVLQGLVDELFPDGVQLGGATGTRHVAESGTDWLFTDTHGTAPGWTATGESWTTITDAAALAGRLAVTLFPPDGNATARFLHHGNDDVIRMFEVTVQGHHEVSVLGEYQRAHDAPAAMAVIRHNGLVEPHAGQAIRHGDQRPAGDDPAGSAHGEASVLPDDAALIAKLMDGVARQPPATVHALLKEVLSQRFALGVRLHGATGSDPGAETGLDWVLTHHNGDAPGWRATDGNWIKVIAAARQVGFGGLTLFPASGHGTATFLHYGRDGVVRVFEIDTHGDQRITDLDDYRRTHDVPPAVAAIDQCAEVHG